MAALYLGVPCYPALPSIARLPIVSFLLLSLLASLALSSSTSGNVFNIKDFGAVGGGETLDTKAIEAAIAEAEKKGGGVVVVPSGGTFLSGPFNLTSNVIF